MSSGANFQIHNGFDTNTVGPADTAMGVILFSSALQGKARVHSAT